MNEKICPATPRLRWTAPRKASVVEAVRAGRLTIAHACERYDLSQEEFASWAASLDAHGVLGLRSTRLRAYR